MREETKQLEGDAKRSRLAPWPFGPLELGGNYEGVDTLSVRGPRCQINHVLTACGRGVNADTACWLWPVRWSAPPDPRSPGREGEVAVLRTIDGLLADRLRQRCSPLRLWDSQLE